jgi:hypothetical protein
MAVFIMVSPTPSGFNVLMFCSSGQRVAASWLHQVKEHIYAHIFIFKEVRLAHHNHTMCDATSKNSSVDLQCCNPATSVVK